ncbi:SusC/RagA family TonB-linked outer membrane protein [Elizabethkingia miricola]|uniref:SusC/RagA family TonB-linked outer membrane protein n=1 Tax=Elizabethkingia miricola TaxID=172045 RepID=UPI0038919D11
MKVAPAFLLAGAMLNAQQKDSTKTKEIEQVVLIGYGKQKKSDLTGSVTALTAKDFNQGAIGSPEQLIQGKAAGVQIVTAGGAPGSGSTIRIRGGASLNASNDPLLVIDGVPVDNSTINGASNGLALIDPNDIESFSILKDASATAIYGSRASNGVIIITTKKGTSGKLKVSYNSNTSIYTKMGTIGVLNGDQFRSVVSQYATDEYKALLGNSNTDWQKQIYQTALGFDNSVAISGGIKGLPYRLSLGYLKQDGIIKTSNFERSNIGINLSPKFFDKHLSVDINYKGIYTENRFADVGAIGAAAAFDPTQSVYNPANTALGGYWEWLNATTGLPNTNGTKNPLSMLNQKIDVSYVTRSLGNIQLDYKFHFLPELRVNVNAGIDYTDSKGNTRVLPTSASAFYSGGTYKRYTQSRKNKLFDVYLNYNKKVESLNSTFDVTAGYSYQDFYRSEPLAMTIKGDPALQPDIVNAFETESTILSYFGRFNYNFGEKYFLTATVRNDRSSRFSKENRSGVFPAIGLAWRIDKENFMKNQNVVSSLKLRAGWGETGQQGVINNDYPFLARYVVSDNGTKYQIGDQFYNTLRAQGYDKNLKWETTITKNIGLDFGFLNDRITGSVEVYEKKSKDLLSIVPVPAGANLTNLLLINVGDMKNKGIEANVNVKAIQKENFSWEFSVNATHYTSKVTNLSAQNNPDQKVLIGGIEGGTGTTVQVHQVGYTPFSFYVYQQVYGQDGKPLEGVYVDRNGDGVINEQDLYQYKSPIPDVLLGFSSRFTYKNWDLGFSLRASIGNYVYNNMASKAGSLQNISNNDYLSNISTSYLDTGFKRAQYLSDYYVENGSFLRMDNLNIGYNFPHFINDKYKLRVSLSAQNVFLITKYSGLDPELLTTELNGTTKSGIDNNAYQRPRIYSLGFNFQF